VYTPPGQRSRREAFLKVRLEGVIGGIRDRILGEDVGKDGDLVRRASGSIKLACGGRARPDTDKVDR